jgi:hypothetical protein
MADDDEGGGGGGGGGPTSPSKAQRQHLAAGSVTRLAKSPLVQLASLLLAARQVALTVSDCMLIAPSLVQLASLLLADRQAHQIRVADTEEVEPALADEEKEAKEEAELGVRCGQLVRAMAPIEPALTNWAAYVEVRSPASDGHLMIPDGQLMITDRQLMTPECHLSAV